MAEIDSTKTNTIHQNVSTTTPNINSTFTKVNNINKQPSVTVASVATPSLLPIPNITQTISNQHSKENALIPNNEQNNTAPRVFCVEDDERLTPVQHMISGALAGMTEHMAMFPIDTVKTRMQSYVAVRDFAGWGMIKTTKAIVSTEGLSALWRGVGAVAVSAGPAHALYFATYESVRSTLWTSKEKSAPAWITSLGGACATIVADGIMTPLDVVKQRMQLSSNNSYSSVWNCTRQVYENYGLRAFFAGYKATLVMNIPFTTVYFTGYESAKHLILEMRKVKEEEFSASSHCIAGGIAGGFAAASTNPLDVVKTRLQTQGEIGARRYRGLKDALNSIRVEEGVSGLMRGVKARVLFHIPAAAVCWTTYEFCKHVMRQAGVDLNQQNEREM